MGRRIRGPHSGWRGTQVLSGAYRGTRAQDEETRLQPGCPGNPQSGGRRDLSPNDWSEIRSRVTDPVWPDGNTGGIELYGQAIGGSRAAGRSQFGRGRRGERRAPEILVG